jgi:cytochrome P450
MNRCPVSSLMDIKNFGEGAPHELLGQCRREAPVCWEAESVSAAGGHWNVFCKKDIDTVMKNPALFTNSRGPFLEDTPPALLEGEMQSLNLLDPPRHGENRAIVDYAFKPAVIRKKADGIRRIARELIGRIDDPSHCEFVADVAAALPTRVICEILGVPESEREDLYDLVNRSVLAQDPDYAASRDDGFDAHAGLIAYGASLAASHRSTPRDSLTMDVLNANYEGQTISDHEYGLLFHNLIVGGIETTRNAISYAVYELIRHPAQYALLQREPHRVPDAVEEVLRYHAPTVYYRRTAQQDTELAGQKIRRGDTLICWLASANRDEANFEDPDTFDITRNRRESVRRHYRTFGVGPHFCIGVHLARLELQIALEEIVAGMTDLELVEPPRRALSMFNDGFKSLCIAFTPLRANNSHGP